MVVRALRGDSLERDLTTVYREMGWIQELDHPTLIRLRELGQPEADSNRPFLVQEYFEGQTLADYVASQGPLSPEDWLQIAWPIARAFRPCTTAACCTAVSGRPAC